MSTHDEGWVDFTHTTRTSKVSAHELFERYREFQGFIAGFSRKELVARRWLEDQDDDSPLATSLLRSSALETADALPQIRQGRRKPPCDLAGPGPSRSGIPLPRRGLRLPLRA